MKRKNKLERSRNKSHETTVDGSQGFSRRDLLKAAVLFAVGNIFKSEERRKRKVDFQVPDWSDTLECRNISDTSIEPFGSVVYRTEGMPNSKTVLAIKMIHRSRSFPKLDQEVIALQRDIERIVGLLVKKGLKNLGGEGFDPGEVTKEDLLSKGYGRTTYSFINLELLFGAKLYSYGFDKTELLKRTHQLLRQNKPLEALKLNPRRTKGMSENLESQLREFNSNCTAVITGGDHLEKNSEPELKELMGDETLVSLLEKIGINVVVIEPRTYQQLNKKIN